MIIRRYRPMTFADRREVTRFPMDGFIWIIIVLLWTPTWCRSNYNKFCCANYTNYANLQTVNVNITIDEKKNDNDNH